MNPQQYLKKYFGYEQFRAGQLEIINSILEKKDTLAVLPTGGGKSICYQIPALMLEGITIVISPLIALMKDQVDTLNKKNIPAEYINSSLNNEEINIIYQKLLQNKIKLLYLAPERINSKTFIELIKQLNIQLIAIDEAHCISEWGHDFRPSYREIVMLADIIPNAISSAFTATATKEVRSDITSSLKMLNPNIFVKSFDRENLSYKVLQTKDKINEIKKIIKKSSGSCMIYCGSRRKVENIYYELKNTTKNIGYYHAGLHEKFRKQQQEQFLNGKTNIIVATSAFGMGIDKPDVRAVIHTDLTPTIESYYQEAGRAGRDGENADCLILYQEGDRGLQEFFIKMNYPRIESIKVVYNYLFDLYDVKIGDYSKKIINDDIHKHSLNCGIETNEFRSILKLLERENVLKWGKGFSSLSIKINTTNDRLREFYENTSEEVKQVLEALLRVIPANDKHRYQNIDMNELINKHNIKKDVLEKGIKSLEFSDIIESNFQRSTGIHLLLARSEKQELPFNVKKYIQKKENILKKLDEVEQYVNTNSCKRNYILSYFGENKYENCGRCNFCLGDNNIQFEEKEKYISSVLKDAIMIFGAKKGKVFFRELLLGSKTKKITSENLNTHYLFGELKGISKEEYEKAWNQNIFRNRPSSNEQLIAGLSFREICKQNKILPSELSKQLMNQDLLIGELKTLFDLDSVDLIKNIIEQDNKINARRMQQDHDFDLNFTELKLIIFHIKKHLKL
ncbi:RecQ family ATP-dependent DNA helicase [Candidatus Kapabacteria bacterium]|nr:RecQ family ATP-dependent DNA helicase [Candidatus Kapabacteria bacterium]